MRILIIVVIAACVLWGGYWFVGSRAVQSGLTTWLSGQPGNGWIAEYSSLKTRGFPNRFDTTITDLELVDQRSGAAWRAPNLKILALSYRPNHIIAIWPDQQSITLPGEQIFVTSEHMVASIAFEPGTSLTLDRSSFVLDNLAFVSSRNWAAKIATARLATRQTDGAQFAHDIAIEASGVQPPAVLLAQLDPAGVQPAVFDTLKFDVTIGFDAQWDRNSLQQEQPQVIALELKIMQAIWGELDLLAAGELAFDTRGVPSGRIAIKATNWREMLAIGIATGAVSQGISLTLERALQLLADTSDDPDILEVPLSFQDGFMSFGPIPLGPAPRLVRR
ncbi:MAG: DUF2125 domain-containing protein [Paracoccaceae bacterium]